MAYDQSVADHYLHGNLLDAIKIALLVIGKTIKTVTIEDLAELSVLEERHVVLVKRDHELYIERIQLQSTLLAQQEVMDKWFMTQNNQPKTDS